VRTAQIPGYALKVVYLTVVGEHESFIPRYHWLMAVRGKIEDGKPTMSEDSIMAAPDSMRVGPTVFE
jgi:hypothetical protein